MDPGITVERRAFLWIPFALPAARVALGAPMRALDGAENAARVDERAVAGGAFSPLTREEFGKRWQLLAHELQSAPAEHDESYAAQLAGLVARVPAGELPRLENAKSVNGITGGLSWALLPGVTVEFRMEPGAVLRCHNHPPQVVLTLCTEGEAAYRHFEIEDGAPPCTQIDGRPFRVRETRAGILRKGQTTSLTRARDGIHGFVGGKNGARIIDFTLSLTEDIETFSYVELSEKPLDVERKSYRAVWLGKDR